MRIGVVGFGLMGQHRAKDIKRMAGRELVAVYDVDLEKLAQFQSEYDFEIEKDLEVMVGRRDIDVIVVAVPHFFAMEVARKALKAGKHVLCEKPLGRNTAEARAIVNAIDGSSLEPGFNYRFYPGIQLARKLLKEGAIGSVGHVRCVLGHGGRPGMEKEWKTDKEMCGGGALLDPGIHGIDLCRFLFGEISQGILWKKNSFWDLKVEDNAFLLLQTEGGPVISAHFSISEWKSLFRFEIFGTDGLLTITGRSRSYGAQRAVLVKRWFWQHNENQKEWNFPAEDNSFFEELERFLNQIEGLYDPDLAKPEDGLRALQIIEKLIASPGEPVIF